MDDDDTIGSPRRIDRRSQPTFTNQRQQDDATLQRRSDKEARIMMRRSYVDD
ncbi:MAG: hypothetical protein ACKO0N_10460 [Planctomycetota bacterium]